MVHARNPVSCTAWCDLAWLVLHQPLLVWICLMPTLYPCPAVRRELAGEKSGFIAHCTSLSTCQNRLMVLHLILTFPLKKKKKEYQQYYRWSGGDWIIYLFSVFVFEVFSAFFFLLSKLIFCICLRSHSAWRDPGCLCSTLCSWTPYSPVAECHCQSM